jgi:hypothetical protein
LARKDAVIVVSAVVLIATVSKVAMVVVVVAVVSAAIFAIVVVVVVVVVAVVAVVAVAVVVVLVILMVGMEAFLPTDTRSCLLCFCAEKEQSSKGSISRNVTFTTLQLQPQAQWHQRAGPTSASLMSACATLACLTRAFANLRAARSAATSISSIRSIDSQIRTRKLLKFRSESVARLIERRVIK